MNITRLVTPEDARALAELVRVNREFLAPWRPIRSQDYFTADGQHAVIQADLEQHEQGSKVPHVILDDSSRVIGGITLNGIVRGPFQSRSLGYWVSASHNGRGSRPRRCLRSYGWPSRSWGYTGCRQRPCCTTPVRSGCWKATDSCSRARRPSIPTSPAGGRTTPCTKW